MADLSPYTIAGQATWIKNLLKPWASELNSGRIIIASSIVEMWEQANKSAIAPTAIIALEGEDIRGNYTISALMSRVDRHWVVAITRPQSMTATREIGLATDYGDSRSFYEIVEVARDVIRSGRTETPTKWPPTQRTEAPIDYKGIKPFPMVDGQILDGYTIHFSIGTQLQQVSGTMPS